MSFQFLEIDVFLSTSLGKFGQVVSKGLDPFLTVSFSFLELGLLVLGKSSLAGNFLFSSLSAFFVGLSGGLSDESSVRVKFVHMSGVGKRVSLLDVVLNN